MIVYRTFAAVHTSYERHDVRQYAYAISIELNELSLDFRSTYFTKSIFIGTYVFDSSEIVFFSLYIYEFMCARMSP